MKVMQLARKKSIWILHIGCSGCSGCSMGLSSCFAPLYDIERLGIKAVGRPDYADILVVTGAVNEKSRDVLLRALNQMQEPFLVLAIGNCASSGGLFGNGSNLLKGIDSIIDVDVYTPGCPPDPQAIMDSFEIAACKLGNSLKCSSDE